jgi:hypothetical protein
MSSFITDELVWAITREREEEARRVRPHTELKLAREKSRSEPPSNGGRPTWSNLQPSLKGH